MTLPLICPDPVCLVHLHFEDTSQSLRCRKWSKSLTSDINHCQSAQTNLILHRNKHREAEFSSQPVQRGSDSVWNKRWLRNLMGAFQLPRHVTVAMLWKRKKLPRKHKCIFSKSANVESIKPQLVTPKVQHCQCQKYTEYKHIKQFLCTAYVAARQFTISRDVTW